MQTSNRVLDDLAKVAGGAVTTLVGIKGEVETLVRAQLERLVAGMDLVPREEFDAVKAMAAKARTEQEKLERRVAGLEAKLGQAKPKAKSKANPRAKPKAAPSAKAADRVSARSAGNPCTRRSKTATAAAQSPARLWLSPARKNACALYCLRLGCTAS